MAKKTTRKKTVRRGAAMTTAKKTAAKKAKKTGAAKKTKMKSSARKSIPKKTIPKKAGKKSTARITDFKMLVSDKPSDVKAVAKKLREIVYELVPDAQENFFDGKLAMALYKDGREICGIQPLDDRCHFYLTRGEKLHDPDRLLEGGGKGIRHIKVRSIKNMPVRAIKKFIREGQKLAKT